LDSLEKLGYKRDTIWYKKVSCWTI